MDGGQAADHTAEKSHSGGNHVSAIVVALSSLADHTPDLNIWYSCVRD